VAHGLIETRDGLSNTIFFGEPRPACAAHHAQGWLRSNSGQGLSTTLVPINTNTCSTDPAASGCARPCNWNYELAIGEGASAPATSEAPRLLSVTARCTSCPTQSIT